MNPWPNIIHSWIQHPFFSFLKGIPLEWIDLFCMVAIAILLLGFLIAPLAGFSTYVERRVAGRMQARIGCNRVGPEGLFQFLADGLKLIQKEDLIPKGADPFLFRMAPYFVVAGSFISFVTIPFGKYLVVADLNVGFLYLMAASSLVVMGILFAGWSSNNKWSLFGAMRSVAQMISYEIPIGMALLIPVLLSGSLSLGEVNFAQTGGMRNWFLFQAFPGPFFAFFIYFISGVAETNRTPFDLPEAESELVAGFHTEYSGIRWGMFFVAEYANMILVSAIAVTAFLGGWQPTRSNIFFGTFALFFSLLLGWKSLRFLFSFLQKISKEKFSLFFLSQIPPLKTPKFLLGIFLVLSFLGASLLQYFSDFFFVTFLFFLAKTYFFVLIMMWLRWTLPRYRIDQLMDLCWKKLVPLGLFSILWTALWILWKGAA